MADERGWQERLAGGEVLHATSAWGGGTVEPLDGDPRGARPWGEREQIRAVGTSEVGGGSGVEVHLEHRESPGVRFTVTLDADHDLAGVAVGVLRWQALHYGGATVHKVDTSPSAGLKLTAAEVRSINWGAFLRVAQRRVLDHYGWLAGEGSRWAGTVARGDRRRPGRRGHGDHHYASVAAEYVELLDAGERHPNKVLAERWGESAKYVTETISRCRPRAHNMLTNPPRRGVPGGELTDKARAILASGEGELGDD